jgi:hypothetical protein
VPRRPSSGGRGKDLGTFRAADPHRHVEGLDADIAEAHRAKLGDAPGAGAGLGRSACCARSDFGGEALGDVEGVAIIGERVVAQCVDPWRDGDRRWWWRCGLGEEGGGDGEAASASGSLIIGER